MGRLIHDHERVMNFRFRPDSNSLIHDPVTRWVGPTENQKRELDMQWKKTLLTAVMGTALSLAMVASASADTVWQSHHPRREEVNNRLNNLNRRINMERAEGEISAKQAHSIHAEDRTIRSQERFDARFNDGHITKAEQRALNQDENGVSRQIGR